MGKLASKQGVRVSRMMDVRGYVRNRSSCMAIRSIEEKREEQNET